MLNIKKQSDLENLIKDGVFENSILEYKQEFVANKPKEEDTKRNSKKKLNLSEDDKKELAKDISAMANSNGGVVIYGVTEEKNEDGYKVPTNLKPIPFIEMDKERLSRLIIATITPVIEFEIDCIPSDSDTGSFYYIITISKSMTAHQNVIDKCYYNRKGAISMKMEDCEIRDVMNRAKTPIINIEYELIKKIVHPIRTGQGLAIASDIHEKMSDEISYELHYWLVNNGHIYAKYVNYFLYVPLEILKDESESYEEEGGYARFYGDNRIKMMYDPILPNMCQAKNVIELTNIVKFKDNVSIKYEVHADNAAINEKEIKIKEIPIITEESTEERDIFGKPIISFNPDI